MPRKNLIRTSEFPYHVTSRSNNKEWFYIPIEQVWSISNQLLIEGKNRFKVNIQAFVLMSNHYHLCLYTPESNIDEFMRFFNKNLGQAISRRAGRINRIFGASYKWTIITQNNHFLNTIRYIYQNPLRAGIATKCEEYPYSDLLFQKKSIDEINWLNQRINFDEEEASRKKLKKYVF